MLKGRYSRNEITEKMAVMARDKSGEGSIDVWKESASAIIDLLGAVNCEPTSRMMDVCGDVVEFSASVPFLDDGTVVEVYYYPTQEQLDNAGDDLSNVPWIIHGYEIY